MLGYPNREIPRTCVSSKYIGRNANEALELISQLHSRVTSHSCVCARMARTLLTFLSRQVRQRDSSSATERTLQSYVHISRRLLYSCESVFAPYVNGVPRYPCAITDNNRSRGYCEKPDIKITATFVRYGRIEGNRRGPR